MSQTNYNQPSGSRELPTEPGFYYWRRSPFSPWETLELRGTPGMMNLYAVDVCYLSIWTLRFGTIGEWIRIPPPEDLLRLTESAKWTLHEEQSDEKPSGA